MCGSIGKWAYFGAANLLMDKGMYAKYSGDSATGLATTKLNIASIPFLSGNSAYRSGSKMDDSRAVYLHDGASSASILMTSGTISHCQEHVRCYGDTGVRWPMAFLHSGLLL